MKIMRAFPASDLDIRGVCRHLRDRGLSEPQVGIGTRVVREMARFGELADAGKRGETPALRGCEADPAAWLEGIRNAA